jgi:hypothetical protein
MIVGSLVGDRLRFVGNGGTPYVLPNVRVTMPGIPEHLKGAAMDEGVETSTPPDVEEPEIGLDDLGHPRGTLALVILYGLIFALVWLGLYLFEFLPRGAPTI